MIFLETDSNSIPRRAFSLTDLLRLLFLITLILQLLTGCGNNSAPLVQFSDPAEQGTVLTQEAPDQIILSEPTLITSQTNSLNSENYWIAWKDPQGNYIAATRSGVPVSLSSGSEGTALNLDPTPIPGPDRPTPGDPSPDIFDPPGNPLPNPDPPPPDPLVCEPTPTPEPPDPTPDPEPTSTPDPDPTSTPLPPGPEPCDAREGIGGTRYGCSCLNVDGGVMFGTDYIVYPYTDKDFSKILN